jgi:hypothetical protein
MVCLRNICVNTLHKGNSIFTNNNNNNNNNKSRRMKWAEHVVRIGERRAVDRVLVGKPEGKSPLGRHRCRWEDNIKMGPYMIYLLVRARLCP